MSFSNIPGWWPAMELFIYFYPENVLWFQTGLKHTGTGDQRACQQGRRRGRQSHVFLKCQIIHPVKLQVGVPLPHSHQASHPVTWLFELKGI